MLWVLLIHEFQGTQLGTPHCGRCGLHDFTAHTVLPDLVETDGLMMENGVFKKCLPTTILLHVSINLVYVCGHKTCSLIKIVTRTLAYD